MSRVALDQVAPLFTLADFSGRTFSLSDLRGHKSVLLIFNRGLT